MSSKVEFEVFFGEASGSSLASSFDEDGIRDSISRKLSTKF